MEKQLDAKTLDEATAWELHLAFLKRLGVDVMTAVSANILSTPDRGVVQVTGFSKDAPGYTCVDQYQFTRDAP